jgi:thiol-disulfide isomerase/thioredoxin
MSFASKLVLFSLAACIAHAEPTPAFPQTGAPMPRFIADRWVNSPPLQPETLRGKVVLVDFWEYTCVNCIRTLPYVKAWARQYGGVGLVVVGVHAPEFEFGKRAENIDRGIRDHGLTYPIAIDNDFSTWTAYRNRAWPAKYLFDAQGKLRGVWLGEGEYVEIENKIRELLAQAGAKALPPPTAEVKAYREQPFDTEITPETYLGTARRDEDDAVARVGSWKSEAEYVEHVGDEPAKLVLDFRGGEVNLVLEVGAKPAQLLVKLDGKDLGPTTIDRSGMFRLVHDAGKGRHRLELETKDPGLRAYAFTFGP